MKKITVFLFTVILCLFTLSVSGQINLKDKLNKAAKSAAQSFGKNVGNQNNQQNTQTQQAEQKQEAPPEEVKPAEPQPAPQEQTPFQSYSKFDFVPGEKVIFFDDFSQDAVGDFPALWNTNGSAEVVTSNMFEGKWMKYSCEESIWTDQALDLPENYTIEFDVIPIAGENGSMAGYSFRIMKLINLRSWDHGAIPGQAAFHYLIEYYGTPRYRSYVNIPGYEDLAASGSKDGEENKQKINQKYHMSLWVQKSRVRVYQNETKMFDLPRVFNVPGGVKMDRLRFENGAAMIGNVRVAVGAPDTRNKLLTEGRLVTYGIYFDVNRDIVKPESYATIKEIGGVLSENPGVRIKIIGHTDSDGADAANLDLSKRRAESVKSELAKNFGIDASRIETEGAGETKPVAPNDSPVNKALNRRVEFVKL